MGLRDTQGGLLAKRECSSLRWPKVVREGECMAPEGQEVISQEKGLALGCKS